MDLTDPAFSGSVKSSKPESNKLDGPEKEQPPVGNQEPPKPLLTERQLNFVTFLHQHYSLTGELMTTDLAVSKGIQKSDFTKWMNDGNVRQALKERGVVFERFDVLDANDAWIAKSLTPRQLVVATYMLDLMDTRSDKRKLQDLNVSTSEWNAWLKDPVFSQYLKDRTDNMLGDSQHEAALALMDKVRSGDIKAIQYYYEFTGRYTRAADKSGSGTIGDLQGVLTRVIEIIINEVDDLDTAQRIAEKIKSLTTAHTVAGELLGSSTDPLPLPQVATARKLTPELEAIMEGVGVNG